MHIVSIVRHNLKVILFFIAILFFQIAASYLFIREFSLHHTQSNLVSFAQRVRSDLVLQNGKFNTSYYTADPLTPHPTGSSGYTSPLYIITSNGFVIERNHPIAGFLDSSNFVKYLSFSKPQTINTETKENWRIESKPIMYKNQLKGIIVVAYYNPDMHADSEIDKKLQTNLETISSEIQFNRGSIDTGHIDIRTIDYDLSFEVIDTYNTVLSNNGRTPSFIDVSYLPTIFAGSQTFFISDSQTHEPYLVHVQPIISAKGTEGVIVNGESVLPLYQFLTYYLLFSVLSSLILLLPVSLFTSYVLRRDITRLFASPNPKKEIAHIAFKKKESVLVIDEQIIEIPYASNQYYVCDALFLNPKKRWEQDELLSRLGDESFANTRKLYDATLAINKKTGIKLIEHKDKTYRINPHFIPVIFV